MQTFTPIEYLKIDIASNFGLDKKDWDVRLAWFDDHETEILEIIDAYHGPKPIGVSSHPLMKQAASQGLFFGDIMAWDKARRNQAIRYPISLDATSSGAQLLAVLVGCRKSALLCNVISTGHREDFYANIYQFIQQRLQSIGISTAGITWDDVKKAVMTSLYGSTKQPRKVFGEGKELQVFYEVMETEAEGVWALNQALLELWNPDAVKHEWVLPDNFHVVIKVIDTVIEEVSFQGHEFDVVTKVNQPMESGLSIGANVIHSIDAMVVREIHRRCSYDPKTIASLLELLKSPVTLKANKQSPNHGLVETLWNNYQESGFLSARILELLDENNMHLVNKNRIWELVSTLPDKPFPVLSVHDCFRVHPNYGNDLRRQYNQLLHEIAHSELLSYIASQIVGQTLTVAKYGNMANDVLQADYALS